MKKSVLAAAFLLVILATYGQFGVTLSFTARNNTAYVQLDSIKLTNRTMGGDTMLYWNDTVISFGYVATPEHTRKTGGFRLVRNQSDPETGLTHVSIRVPGKDRVDVRLTDRLGLTLLHEERILEAGVHTFRINPGGSHLCLFSARWRGEQVSRKILPVAFEANGPATLDYTGAGTDTPSLKSAGATNEFIFIPGDELLFTGYVNGAQSGIRDHPYINRLYIFQFATDIPCTDMPSITYGGHVYNTLQVYSQCWLQENMNVGLMLDGGVEQTDNGIIEKHCLDNREDSCYKYGGLYQWDEAMQYTLQPGAQGICPDGWHIPDDDDWKVLEGAVDSQFGIADPEWDRISYRGYDAGANLKSTNGWYANGNGTDPFGFFGMPAGYSFTYGFFWKTGKEANWWTSTPINEYAWSRLVAYNYNKIHRLNFWKGNGFSVRCLRN